MTGPDESDEFGSRWRWPKPNLNQWYNAACTWKNDRGWVACYWLVSNDRIKSDWCIIGTYPTREEAEHAAQLAFDMGLYR
jgi:hypothetical protein